jgi:catalase
MAMRNPVGRVNYQPNSWNEGPRESPQKGFPAFADQVEGQRARLRAESFADHYSQARQFFISQTVTEQRHIVMALTFELSKCENPVIRERMISHLLNVDETLGAAVADKLGIKQLPEPADAAVRPRDDLPASPALSIIKNGPDSFAGRKVGVLVSPGADAALLKKLQTAIEKEGAVMEVVAPKVGGVEAADGSWVEARHMIDGGPSVLFDAVALILTEEGAERLTGEAAARDFVADAFTHCKFIGFTTGATPLLQKAGVDPEADEGLIGLDNPKGIASFIQSCRRLRLWSREMAVKL